MTDGFKDPTANLASPSVWVITVLILIYGVVRFVGLERAPPGFYTDEAVVASQVIYFSETGRDIYGHVPFFVPAAGAGYVSPVHLYPVAVWVRLFGHSISALRSYAGFLATLTLIGLFRLAVAIMDRGAALGALLSASLSPWIFQFSRQAIDDPMMFLCGMVWGGYFFLQPDRPRNAVGSALAFSFSAYGYPSSRTVLPLLFLLLWWLKSRRSPISGRFFALFFATGILLCWPIVYFTFNGLLLTRNEEVAVYATQHLKEAGITNGWGLAAEIVRNYLRHLSPRYLFISGDANLRHSSQFAGELSWLDGFALLVGTGFLGLRVARSGRFALEPAFAFILAGFVIGITPAALTSQALPHSMRSCASWPFAALATGFILSKAARRAVWVLPSAAVISTVFAGSFLWDYFAAYPSKAGPAYNTFIKDLAIRSQRSGDWRLFDRLADHTNPLDMSYFQFYYGEKSLADSLQLPAWWVKDISTAAVYANLGGISLRRGEFSRALRVFDDALKWSPRLAAAEVGRADVLQVTNRLPEAIRQYEAALLDHPELVDARIKLAIALVRSNRIPEAIRQLEDLLRQDPSQSRARALLARIRGHPGP